MHDRFPIDDSLFDRLVDGELAPGQRRELLASLDSVPDGWRRCALSFLEAQSWREGLGQFVREADVRCERFADAVAPSINPPVRQSVKHGVAWLAIAAGLLVAFTLGKTASRDNGVPLADGGAADPGVQVADVVPPSTSPDGASSPDALTLFVRDDTGQTRPLRVPLVDAGTMEEQLGLEFQSGVPAHVRAQLQNRGFDVQSRQRYAPFLLENGQPMFVPVEDTKIVPVSRRVY